MKKLYYCVLLVCLVGMVAATASASTLDFSLSNCGLTGQPACSISYAGGSNPLVITGIPVTSVLGENTPLNNNVSLNILDGTLDVTSGNLTSTTSNTYNFGGTNTITLVLSGCVDIDQDNDTTCDSSDLSGVLAIGDVTSASVLTFTGTTFKIAGVVGLDFKNPILTAFYGLPGGIGPLYNYGMNYSFDATGQPPSAFTSTRGNSGDFVNNIPEPASLALLGAGLLALGGIVRRKLHSA